MVDITTLRDDVATASSYRRLADRAHAEAYVASICFKHGPPELTGVELEWTLHHRRDPGRQLEPTAIADALGPHAPTTLAPRSEALPLPHGSQITLEPGGQVEISTPPRKSLPALLDAAAADAGTLAELLAAAGYALGTTGCDPHRPPRRLLNTPRYSAMEAAFAPLGMHGITMMCSTAGVQVCVDAGQAQQTPARWAALHLLGPVFNAAFANSTRLAGRVTAWSSIRQRVLFGVDPVRMRPSAVSTDPAAAWARRVLDTPVICIRRPGGCWEPPTKLTFADWLDGALPTRPTTEDLDYHLSTLFPPVRPRGYLEVRYLDAQPDGGWVAPTALLTALLTKASTVDAVLDVAAPAAGRWLHGARYGLADRRIAEAARGVFELGVSALAETGLSRPLIDSITESAQRRMACAREGASG